MQLFPPYDAPGVLPESTVFNEADNTLKIREWEAQLAVLIGNRQEYDWRAYALRG